GRLARVDDEARLGPAAGGLLEAVSPPPVISECGAAEEFRVGRGRLVGEADQNLALHVHPFVIVPIELRRGDAVAYQDRFRVELLQLFLRPAHASEAVAAGDAERGRALHRLQRRFRAGDDADERDGLEVLAVLAQRLETGLFELVGDVFRRHELAAGARAAAFHAVARQVGDAGLDAVGGNLKG